MKLIFKIALSTAIITAAIIIFKTSKNSGEKDCDQRLDRVADEGYETADDILFPGKFRPDSRLHYGPVLPS